MVTLAGEEYLFYPGAADQRCPAARHDGRPGGQRHHGARGADPRVALDRPGREEQRRGRHRPGRAGQRTPGAQPAGGEDPRDPGGRGRRRRSRASTRRPSPRPTTPPTPGEIIAPSGRLAPTPLDIAEGHRPARRDGACGPTRWSTSGSVSPRGSRRSPTRSTSWT